MADPDLVLLREPDGTVHEVPRDFVQTFVDGKTTEGKLIYMMPREGATFSPSEVLHEPLNPEAAQSFEPPAEPLSTDAPELEARRKQRLENSQKQAPLAHDDVTTEQGRYAPQKPPIQAVEGAWRGFVDQGALGFDDTMAGLGAAARHLSIRRAVGQGVDAPLKSVWDAPVSQALDEGARVSQEWNARNQEVFEAQPLARFLGAAPIAMAQNVLAQSYFPVSQAGQAATAGRDLISRAAQGAINTATNPGVIGASVLSGIGHADANAGDPADAAMNYVESAGGNAVGEYLGNVAMAPLADMLLTPARWFGRDLARDLRDSLANSERAQLLDTAFDSGASFQTFSRPTEGRLIGGPRTSIAGIAPGPIRDVVEKTGSAQPAERLIAQTANRVAKGVENQRGSAVDWIREEKDNLFASPEGQKEIPSEPILAGVPTNEGVSWIDRKILRPRPYQPGRQSLDEPITRRDAEGHALPPEGRVERQMRQFRENPPPPPQRTINAQELDGIIQFADDKAKAHTGKLEPDIHRVWAKYAADLRAIRDAEYPRLAAIDKEGARRLSEFEANASQFGIDPRSSPVVTTEGGAPAQLAQGRLGSIEKDPMMQDSVARLESWDPGIDPLSKQARGVAATQKLIADAKKGTEDPLFRIPILGTKIPRPGYRAAGMDDLGPNSGAALRGGMMAGYRAAEGQPHVSPEEVANIAAFLGYAHTPSVEEFERIRQILGLSPEQMEHYRQPP